MPWAGRPGEEAPLSEVDRRQRELYNKQQQLLREQRTADQEKLLAALGDDLGFYSGRPVASLLVFRCCLQWKTFQADRTPLFDRIIATMGSQVRWVLARRWRRRRSAAATGMSPVTVLTVTRPTARLVPCTAPPPPLPPPPHVQVELHQENNASLAYWLSNTVTLLYLMQKNVKPASGGGYAARLRQQGQQVTRGLFGGSSSSKPATGFASFFTRTSYGGGSPAGEASIHGGAAGGFRQVRQPAPLAG